MYLIIYFSHSRVLLFSYSNFNNVIILLCCPSNCVRALRGGWLYDMFICHSKQKRGQKIYAETA